MTNTNELTAKLKAAAQDEIMCREACDTSDLWQDVASPENVLALTDALEAAEKRIAAMQGLRAQFSANADRDIAALRQRIAELDSLLERECEKSRRMVSRIASLESRTLTVKLPAARRVKLVSGEYVNGWTAYEVTSAIVNAGIKLQIEGE